jgi:hypothetical protein
MPEWIASDSTDTEPVRRPMTIFPATSAAFDATDSAATACFFFVASMGVLSGSGMPGIGGGGKRDHMCPRTNSHRSKLWAHVSVPRPT